MCKLANLSIHCSEELGAWQRRQLPGDGGILVLESGDKSLSVFVDLRAKTKHTVTFLVA